MHQAPDKGGGFLFFVLMATFFSFTLGKVILGAAFSQLAHCRSTHRERKAHMTPHRVLTALAAEVTLNISKWGKLWAYSEQERMSQEKNYSL